MSTDHSQARCPSCLKQFPPPDEEKYVCPHCGAQGRTRSILAAQRAKFRKAACWQVTTADGEEFGPATWQELEEWIADGTLDADCEVLCEGDADWQPIGELFPEFAAEEEENSEGGFSVDASYRRRRR